MIEYLPDSLETLLLINNFDEKINYPVMDINEYKPVPYPKELKVLEYQNGEEILIHVKNPKWYSQEDEKNQD